MERSASLNPRRDIKTWIMGLVYRELLQVARQFSGDFGTFNSWKHLWTRQNLRKVLARCGKVLWNKPIIQVKRALPQRNSFEQFCLSLQRGKDTQLYRNQLKNRTSGKEPPWIWVRPNRRRSSSTWISWAMQADLKFIGRRRRQKPILQVISV